MSIRFVKELPPVRRGRGPTLPIAELDARPGVWAILREYKTHNGAHPTATRLRARLGEQYEFTGRSITGTNGQRGSVLYGRKIKK